MQNLYTGDYVVHNTFPPIEGYVVSLIPLPNNRYKVGVAVSTERIYWDTDDTWELSKSYNNVDGETDYPSDLEIIDAEFTEIE